MVEVGVEVPQVLGEFASAFDIERDVEFLEDGLSLKDVVVDGPIEEQGIFFGEADAGLIEKAQGALIEHQDQLTGRGGLGCDFLVGPPGIRMHHRGNTTERANSSDGSGLDLSRGRFRSRHLAGRRG